MEEGHVKPLPRSAWLSKEKMSGKQLAGKCEF